MFTHPQILTDLARERRHELIAEARQHRLATVAARTGTDVRGAPARRPDRRDWSEEDRKSAGRLAPWEATPERTGGRAR